MVERVEGFKPELQAHPFGEFDVLDQRHIPDLEARTQQRAGTGTAKVPHGGANAAVLKNSAAVFGPFGSPI